MPDGTPRVPAHSDPGPPRVGRDQRSRRVRALARLAAIGAPVDLGRIGAGPRRRNRQDCGEAMLLDDVEKGICDESPR